MRQVVGFYQFILILLVVLIGHTRPAGAGVVTDFENWILLQRSKFSNPVVVRPDQVRELESASHQTLRKLAAQITERKLVHTHIVFEAFDEFITFYSTTELLDSAPRLLRVIKDTFIDEMIEHVLERDLIFRKLNREVRLNYAHNRRFLAEDWFRLYLDLVRHTLTKNPGMAALRELGHELNRLYHDLAALTSRDHEALTELNELQQILQDRLESKPTLREHTQKSPTRMWMKEVMRHSTPSVHLTADDLELQLTIHFYNLLEQNLGEEGRLFKLVFGVPVDRKKNLERLPYELQSFGLELIDLQFRSDPSFLDQVRTYYQLTTTGYQKLTAELVEKLIQNKTGMEPGKQSLWLKFHRNRALLAALEEEEPASRPALLRHLIEIWVWSLSPSHAKWEIGRTLVAAESLHAVLPFLLKNGTGFVQAPFVEAMIGNRDGDLQNRVSLIIRSLLDDSEIAIPLIQSRLQQKQLEPRLGWRLHSALQLFFSGEGIKKPCDALLRRG